ncbi:hypothetical protein NKH77_53795 [Streptomyces sp. M19]
MSHDGRGSGPGTPTSALRTGAGARKGGPRWPSGAFWTRSRAERARLRAAPRRTAGTHAGDAHVPLLLRPGWIFERKLDGQRCLAFRDGGDVRLASRGDKPLTRTYPEIADALRGQAGGDFVVDGEIVAFEGGRTSFSGSSAAWASPRSRGRARWPAGSVSSTTSSTCCTSTDTT